MAHNCHVIVPVKELRVNNNDINIIQTDTYHLPFIESQGLLLSPCLIFLPPIQYHSEETSHTHSL